MVTLMPVTVEGFRPSSLDRIYAEFLELKPRVDNIRNVRRDEDRAHQLQAFQTILDRGDLYDEALQFPHTAAMRIFAMWESLSIPHRRDGLRALVQTPVFAHLWEKHRPMLGERMNCALQFLGTARGISFPNACDEPALTQTRILEWVGGQQPEQKPAP